jgi:NADPH-dependent curcumin reductase CurA
VNRQILLNNHPKGDLVDSDFKHVESEIPSPGEGEALVQTLYLALEPAMKGWMENRSDYVAPMAIGDVMRGNGTGRVIESNNPDLPVGTVVAGSWGWQEYATVGGKDRPVQALPEGMPIAAAMALLGTTGLTAYFGMLDVGEPVEGDAVLISGAAGATGSVAGQIAKLKGCRVVGLAGSQEKCDWLVAELGFDAAINYRSADVKAEVKEHFPKGINVFYDNVGGEILDIALANLALHARVVICGGISRYNLTGEIPGPKNYFNLVFRRSRMQGFILFDYMKRYPEAMEFLKNHYLDGSLKSKESVTEGFENMPNALMGLFSGENMGKQLVKVSD